MSRNVFSILRWSSSGECDSGMFLYSASMILLHQTASTCINRNLSNADTSVSDHITVSSRLAMFSQRSSENTQLKIIKMHGEKYLPNAEMFKYARINAGGPSLTQQQIKLAALPTQALCEFFNVHSCMYFKGWEVHKRSRSPNIFFSIQNLRNAVFL